jgi:hypothetical protein
LDDSYAVFTIQPEAKPMKTLRERVLEAAAIVHEYPNQGVEFENNRLQPLIELLAECAEALHQVDPSQPRLTHMIRKHALAKLEAHLEFLGDLDTVGVSK